MKHIFVLIIMLSVGCSCDKLDRLKKQHNIDDLIEGVAVETVDTSLSACFVSEMNNTIATIESIADSTCLVLNVVADNHISSSSINIEANRETIRNITYFNKNVRCDGVVHLGDVIAESLCRTDGLSDNELYRIMENYLINFSNSSDKVFLVNGNHDGSLGKNFVESVWVEMTKPLIKADISRYEDTPFYYYDFPGKNVRGVFLAMPDNYAEGKNVKGFTQRALDWFKTEALDVPEGTKVIVFGHIPVHHANYMKDGSIYNRSAFEDICWDFNRNSKSKIICFISGHAHTDQIVEPGWTYEGTRIVSDGVRDSHTYENRMPCPVVVIGHNYFNGYAVESKSGMGGVNYERTRNTASQDLWDTIVYNPVKETISFVRFGAGTDRVIDLKSIDL